MRRFILLTIFCFTITNSIAIPLATPTYPDCFNLDNYNSISLKLRSREGDTISLINEITSNDNKRTDISTTKPTSQIISFRAFNGNNYTILTISNTNEKTCNHIGEVDSYMFLNNLRKAWEKNKSGDLTFLGKQLVQDEECNIWQFEDDNNKYELSTTIPKANEKSQLKMMKRDKTKNDGKVINFIYDRINLTFNYKIEDGEFSVPDDVKCE